jgi:hypothetical protein
VSLPSLEVQVREGAEQLGEDFLAAEAWRSGRVRGSLDCPAAGRL